MSDRYDDNRKPLFSRVLDTLRGYDCRLFVRWNLSCGWWEVWRWRDVHVIPREPTSSEIDEKAAAQFTVAHDCFDVRVVRRLYMTDLARHSETLNPDEINRSMEAIERKKDEAKDREIEAACMDWATDNSRRLKSALRDEFSGYSP